MTSTGTSATHRLVLLRHAKAEPAGGVDDVLRPLALNGRRHAGAVGAALVQEALVPDLALRSSAVRTRQTWDLLAAQLGDVEPEVETLDALYSAGVRELVTILKGVDARVRTLLVVGHEPTMAATAEHLAGPGSDASALAQVRVGVPTAAYSVLEADLPWAEWGPRAATLVDVRRPAR
ncbi:phosphohistidine phosphatase [Sediminihabitans luteus]|uniref:Phosphohistidine phosphatase n=1 Tax=Sediminihabitans luteus TaxID=1138585 RepID=A0A2M9CR93_9CELL|nr:histidine phosphatase family protein [Sediminihabitans luteus]PJJ74407.1 phosphohistidine phosphatase [Sediminihabitans luteus]GIJ00226.1 phosphoglycerate mutase [Sediminihabitans luteus]